MTATPALFDQRWFFETLNGGRMVTPYDLASYSTLVELNSGSGAPSTDLRGTTVQGTYREWGPLEYDSRLRIATPISYGPITSDRLHNRQVYRYFRRGETA